MAARAGLTNKSILSVYSWRTSAALLLCCIILSHVKTADADIPHGHLCNNTDTVTCQPPTNCIPFNSENRCLCRSMTYFNSTTRQCESEDILNVNKIMCNSDKDIVTCSWSHNKDSSISYEFLVNGSLQQNISSGQVQIKLPSPGTSYVMKITSSFIPALEFYSLSKSSVVTIWTKPDKPGTVKNVTATNLSTPPENFLYNIIFGPSRGNVSRYSFEINGGSIYKNDSVTVTTVSNVRLKPDTEYTYSITAYNGNNSASQATQDSFRTPQSKSSKVKGMAIKEEPCITLVNWMEPDYPNGQIAYYKVSARSVNTDVGCEWNCSSFSCNMQNHKSSGMNCSTDKVKKTGREFSVALMGLEANTTYIIAIVAVNGAGDGESSNENFTTNIAAADVGNVSLSSERYLSDDLRTKKIRLNVTWTPSTSTGAKYRCLVLKKSNNSEEYEFVTSVADVDKTSRVFGDVLAHWNYMARVQAYTCKGDSEWVSSQPHTTHENNPGQVQNLSVKQNAKFAQNVTVMFDCLSKNEYNASEIIYIVKTVLLNETGDEVNETNQNLPSTSCNRSNSLGGVLVGKTYRFAVKAKNSRYNGEFSQAKNVTIEAKRPLLSEKYTSSSDLMKPKSEDTRIGVQLCVSCLLDSSQGIIVNSGLIVCVKSELNACENIDANYTNFITWGQADRLRYMKPYRTTADDWLEHLHMNSDNYTFDVGVDTNCATSSESRYCNGPLPTGKFVIISVVVCTEAGCDQAKSEDIFVMEEPQQSNTTEVTALSVLAVFVLICAIAVLISRRLVPWKVSFFPWACVRQVEEPEIPQKRPVKMRDFEEHVKKLHKDSNLLMQSEFEDIKLICMTFKNSCNEAQREANRIKNRFVDILPYDDSRVKLNVQPEDEETNDFINANYIPGFNSVREYIATQGPMHFTVPDFWRMIWEQKSQIIIMLSDLQENGRLKVDQYWPDNLNEAVNFENVIVEVINFSKLNKYIIRSFRISKGEETRKVTQFFLPGWNDFSANLSCNDVLEFIKLFRQEITPDVSGPIVVHCSAGVGRTGTLITLDYFMQYVDKYSLDDDIDIFDYILKMRRNRSRMVQAESQYIFIFDAVLEMIKKKIAAENDKRRSFSKPSVCDKEQIKEVTEDTFVDIQLKDDKCAYTNGGFEPDN